MKINPKKAALIGLAATTVFATGCEITSPATVYGPPNEMDQPTETIDPDNNLNDDVYGPPTESEDFDDYEDESDVTPDENMSPDVYGPAVED